VTQQHWSRRRSSEIDILDEKISRDDCVFSRVCLKYGCVVADADYDRRLVGSVRYLSEFVDEIEFSA
jgi:hypothetical protein